MVRTQRVICNKWSNKGPNEESNKAPNLVVRAALMLLVVMALVFSTTTSSQAALFNQNFPDFRELAKSTGPAVVNISTEKVVEVQQGNLRDLFRGFPQGTPFDQFFKQFDQFQGESQPRQQKKSSLGSGFIISNDGYIVTNNHVIEGADTIKVTVDNNGDATEYIAALIGADAETDLALLKIEVQNALPVLPFGDSDALEVGEWLMAIGNPFGLDHTVTTGILSAKGRDISSGPFDNFLQTDASINPGNSGGPLLNMQGEVIGINTAIIASGQGIGFAIPSNMASQIIEQLKTHKKVQRGWIGVTIKPIDNDTARALGLKKSNGAFVESVIAGDPADKAGIKAGDILLKVDGKEMENSTELLLAVAHKRPGEKVKITLLRNGKFKDVTLVLGERNADGSGQKGAPSAEQGKAPAVSMLGISARPVTAEEAQELKMNQAEGLLITHMDQDSPLRKVDIRTGDVILTANLQAVPTAQALNAILEKDAKSRGAVMLQLQRGPQAFFRTVLIDGKTK
ncbi:MAG: Do family serine endopeptidase [Pseudomonadota bacterium]